MLLLFAQPALSRANYEALLNGWSQLTIQDYVTLGDIEDNFSFNFQDVTSGAVVYSWDDSAQSWTPVDTDSETITAGNGVIIYFFDDSDDTITSSGFSFSVPGTDSPDTDVSRSGLDTSDRFLMLGNPYLRPYDLSSLDLTTGNGFQQTVQVWDPDQDAFVPRDRSMGETVAGMQGFFAERSTPGEGATSLTFSAGGTQDGDLGNFIGKSVADTIQTAPVELALTLTASGGDTLSTDRVTIRFDERAAPGWDAYEATKLPLPGSDGAATLTSPIERAGPLTRRRLAAGPFPSGDEAAAVPLSARSVDATGTATVRLLDARFRLRATSGSLPIEFADFTAERDGQAAVLRWRTASETGNAGFAVQHRRPGTQGDAGWTQVGFVEGGGTTDRPQRYRFRTDRLAAGTHRFRLKQGDIDGSDLLSESVSVQIGPAGAYRLTAPTPNPTAPAAQVRLTVVR